MTSELRERRSPRPQLPSGWIYEDLGDLIEGGEVSYGIVQPGSHDLSGVPIVRVNNLRRGRIATDDVLRVSSEIEGRYLRTRLRGGEVLLSLVGSVGEVAIVPESLADWNVARAIAVIRPSGKVSAPWLKYCLSSELVQRHMRMWQTDTVQATLNLRDVRRLPIVMPPRSVRDAIAGLLSALDAKIDCDRKISALCVQLAMALLSSAVHHCGVTVTVDNVAEFHNRRRVPLSGRERVEKQGEYPYYGATGVLDHVDAYLFDGVHVLVGEDGTVTSDGAHPMVQYVWGKFWVNNHAHVLTGKSISHELLRTALLRADVTPALTGAVQPKLSMSNLRRVELRLPERKQGLELAMTALGNVERAATDEVRATTLLRDTLLPRLLSGELHVRDAEGLVGEAV